MKAQISDHALVRYIERFYDIDVERYRAEMLEIAQPMVDARVAHAPFGGVWFVVTGDTVRTVLPYKPKSALGARHDAGGSNGTHRRSEPLHWKGRARKRAHK